jgi:transcriptional repressor NrdR
VIAGQTGDAMKCPFCGYQESKVIDSRPAEENDFIRRRRECLECAKRFTTFEKIDEIPITVVKKNNEREPFDPRKIQAGLLRATIKREVARDVLEAVVSDIENEIRNQFKHEISSEEIGEMLLRRLKEIDTVAYVRFASVYKDFKDVDEFIREIETVQNDHPAAGTAGAL